VIGVKTHPPLTLPLQESLVHKLKSLHTIDVLLQPVRGSQVNVVQLLETPQTTFVQEQLLLIQKSFVHLLLSLQSEFTIHWGLEQWEVILQFPTVALSVLLSHPHVVQLSEGGQLTGV
jgi:hypothetical protein